MENTGTKERITAALASLGRARRQCEAAQERFDARVSNAREAGASWDAISAETGINRETLRRRFG